MYLYCESWPPHHLCVIQSAPLNCWMSGIHCKNSRTWPFGSSLLHLFVLFYSIFSSFHRCLSALPFSVAFQRCAVSRISKIQMVEFWIFLRIAAEWRERQPIWYMIQKLLAMRLGDMVLLDCLSRTYFGNIIPCSAEWIKQFAVGLSLETGSTKPGSDQIRIVTYCDLPLSKLPLARTAFYLFLAVLFAVLPRKAR